MPIPIAVLKAKGITTVHPTSLVGYRSQAGKGNRIVKENDQQNTQVMAVTKNIQRHFL